MKFAELSLAENLSFFSNSLWQQIDSWDNEKYQTQLNQTKRKGDPKKGKKINTKSTKARS